MKKAVLFTIFLTFAMPAASAQTVLTQYQVSVFEKLMAKAKLVDPSYLQARAQEMKGRQDSSALSAISATASASIGTSGSVGLTNQSGFDQVTPGARLGVSVDITRLVENMRGTNRAQIDALTASTSAAGRDLRVRVLEVYTAYLSAIRQAGNAADVLTVARANVQQQTARAQAGAATGVDVMRASQEMNRADSDLYDANLRLAVAKQRLASVCGLNLGELDALLTGAKPKP